jgi:hypothetical protein
MEKQQEQDVEILEELNQRKSGKVFRDIRKGEGFYISRMFNQREREHIFSFKSKKGRFKLIDYAFKNDPTDMIDWSEWQFLGFEGEKSINDMNIDEYKKLIEELNK